MRRQRRLVRRKLLVTSDGLTSRTYGSWMLTTQIWWSNVINGRSRDLCQPAAWSNSIPGAVGDTCNSFCRLSSSLSSASRSLLAVCCFQQLATNLLRLQNTERYVLSCGFYDVQIPIKTFIDSIITDKNNIITDTRCISHCANAVLDVALLNVGTVWHSYA